MPIHRLDSGIPMPGFVFYQQQEARISSLFLGNLPRIVVSEVDVKDTKV